MEKEIEIYNVDESGFNYTSNKTYGWYRRNQSNLSTHQQHITNTTLVSAVTMAGDHYYCIVKNSHNRKSFCYFLTMLVRRLDETKPNWRQNSIILVDNATLHKTPEVYELVRKL